MPFNKYFGNLAHAVQPYAHYTPELRGWQLAVRSYDGKTKFLVEVGPKSYDPVRALRISLLHALVVWTLGRIVIINHTFSNSGKVASFVSELGKLLGASKLLFKSKNWADEIAPHVLFLPGKSYVDD